MEMQTLDREGYKVLHEVYKDMDVKALQKDASVIIKAMKQHTKKEFSAHFTKDAYFVATATICCKVAKVSELDEFIQFLESGEAPPIKLTQEEMEMLKGGGFWGTFAKVAIGGAVVVGGAMLLGKGNIGAGFGKMGSFATDLFAGKKQTRQVELAGPTQDGSPLMGTESRRVGGILRMPGVPSAIGGMLGSLL